MRWGLAVFCLSAVLLNTWVASAQNLLSNPEFDTTVDGWVPSANVWVWWSPIDVDDDPQSGSAGVDNSMPGESHGAGINQCVSTVVVAGAEYTYGGMAYTPSGQNRTGPAFVGLRWYSAPGCTDTIYSPQPRDSTSTVGSWVQLEDTVVAPEGAVSVMFLAFPSKNEAGGTLTAHFDNLFLRRAALFADGFEAGNTSAWSMTIP